VSLRGIGSYTLNRVNFLDPDNPTKPDRIQSELGNPTFGASFQASYTKSALTLSYDLRYIGRQTIGPYEAYFAFDGQPPLNPEATAERFYPDVFYHDVRISYDINSKFALTLGVDNLTDKLPPFGLTGTSTQDGIYDNVGRTYFAAVRFKL
jgi:outer membrane receptor protein involved in Fe transport